MMIMYRGFLIALILVIFAGCSAPKPEMKPSWYTSPPKDYNYFYAVGSGDSVRQAKNSAIVSLRHQLNILLDEEFKKADHRLAKIDEKLLTEIFQQNSHITKMLPSKIMQVDKSANFKGEYLVLMKLSRKKLFDELHTDSFKKFETLKKNYKSIDNDVAIKKISIIKTMLKEYPELASYAQFKKSAVSTYSANDDFDFLKKIYDEYNQLKSTISFYILSDSNSYLFSKVIKKAIKKEGFKISKIPLSDNSLKLIVKSETTDEQDYSFMKSSSLIKLSTYDINKNKILFRQHTFVGKSRKSYTEAKEQAVIHMGSKIKRFGIYDFIGVEK